MEGKFPHLEELLEKAEYLEQKTKQLAGENRFLKEKIRNLEQSLDEKSGVLQKITAEYDTVKLAGKLVGESGNGDLSNLKTRIDKLIREIDLCMKVIGD